MAAAATLAQCPGDDGARGCLQHLVGLGASLLGCDDLSCSLADIAVRDAAVLSSVLSALPPGSSWAAHAMCAAASGGHTEAVAMLMSSGARPETPAVDFSPVWFALVHGAPVAAVRELVRRDPAMLARESLVRRRSGEAAAAVAVGHAVLTGSWGVVRVLLESMAAFNLAAGPDSRAEPVARLLVAREAPLHIPMAWAILLHAPADEGLSQPLLRALGSTAASPPPASATRDAPRPDDAERRALCDAVLTTAVRLRERGVAAALASAVRAGQSDIVEAVAARWDECSALEPLGGDQLLGEACSLPAEKRCARRHIAATLIGVGADIFATNLSGTTGLYRAASAGWSADDLRWLMSSRPGAGPDTGCRPGVSVLAPALRFCDDQAACEIIRRIDRPADRTLAAVSLHSHRRFCGLAWGMLKGWERGLARQLPHLLSLSRPAPGEA
jgi:hypothetical protein